MKKVLFFVLICFFGTLRVAAQQISYSNNDGILLVNGEPYEGDKDFLRKMDPQWPSGDTLVNNLITFGCGGPKEPTLVYAQSSVDKSWFLVANIQTKTWDKWGDVLKVIKPSDEEVFIFFSKKRLHLKKIRQGKKEFWATLI